ncbi:hypothetical protein [Natronorubrum texcoconense]|uniref:hypothetical protein n=1 Tax=Natronorubrum texcoconense TaxID=1095776 RepID=UPI001113E0FA|nr:hypothetical protein [Natronorubrum texcoconense]
MVESTSETENPLSPIRRIFVAVLTIAGLAGLYFAVGVLFVGSGLVDILLGFVGLVVASSAAYWIFHRYTTLKNSKRDTAYAE